MELSLVDDLGLGGIPQASVRVLLVSEDKRDYLRLHHIFTAIGPQRYELTWCAELALAADAMLAEIHDIILLDYSPASAPEEGRRLLHNAKQNNCTAPVIVLTEDLDPQLDNQVIKAGASDYLVKSRLSTQMLERACRHAIDRKQAELELAKLAHYDALSGAPNRVLFRDRVERAIQRAERGQHGMAVFYLDFDGFKAVNDTYGHTAGDKLIEMIAERLAACMRKTDSLARLGGDEFTVLLEDVNSRADIINVARKIIRNVAKPFPIFGHEIVAGCSIGIAQYPEMGEDYTSLVNNADSAMYYAKQVEGSAYHFFNDQQTEGGRDGGAIEEELKSAIHDNELRIYFQPRVELSSRKISGVECLLRWEHPTRGLLKPEDFLTVARETGQIAQIGYWVLDEACQALSQLKDLGYPGLKMSVNLAVQQLQDPAFASTVRRILEQSGVDAQRLELELSEQDLMQAAGDELLPMQAISELGPTFAIDNFGTGHSSFPRLQQLPIRSIKIDRGIVGVMLESDADQRVVKAMINLGKSLELDIIAAGAEQIEQVRFLKQHDCDAMQGHYFSEAVPFDSLCQLLNAKVLLAV